MFELMLRDPFFSSFFDGIDRAHNTRKWTDLGDKYVLRMNVPGYAEEDINIKVLPVDNHYSKIHISGKVDREDEFGMRTTGSFTVDEYLHNTDPEKVVATLKNGQLTVVAEKKETKPELPEGKEVKVLTA